MKRQAFFKLMACAAFLSAVSLRLPVLGACYAILSLYAFALYGIDKRRAIRGQRRIPEHRLLLPALFGGWTGAYLGSRIFRHKTAKKRFVVLFRLTVSGNVLATLILIYSGLNLNQYGVASPCRTICTVCGFVALS
ncbi:TPA: DUF1294 domain-containing protein [Neisseria meningitidis]|uniref:DUF1294 domain-containing protein n=2 Tax=Neisseria meningitidis TaxID=487 RepID=UPI000681A33A|nr:DUF1294 domain-containing protein [Neisseria meningitidis]MCL4983023.1 DUF1294 domain-containing protein [Neisseria meningitidis]MCL5002923.1 DUF1294 domain-containing protein [Neisseria meningitidis]MCL5705117.1 DUF1294 domain-containing protein [Neisseria meningitidis]MCL5711131.1 DUF1294 domain-containing protein [Neisseria meningitidis]MCL5713337.1 DUF1294 domain-containing protein [Neisseria meningitidis]